MFCISSQWRWSHSQRKFSSFKLVPRVCLLAAEVQSSVTATLAIKIVLSILRKKSERCFEEKVKMCRLHCCFHGCCTVRHAPCRGNKLIGLLVIQPLYCRSVWPSSLFMLYKSTLPRLWGFPSDLIHHLTAVSFQPLCRQVCLTLDSVILCRSFQSQASNGSEEETNGWQINQHFGPGDWGRPCAGMCALGHKHGDWHFTLWSKEKHTDVFVLGSFLVKVWSNGSAVCFYQRCTEMVLLV